MRFSLCTIVPAVSFALAAASFSHLATAAPCADQPNPLYATSTTLVKPYFAKVAKKLATAAVNPSTIVYQQASTCVAYGNFKDATALKGAGAYWDSVTGTETSCELPAAGIAADVAFGDLDWKTCPIGDQPANITAVQVFVQPVGFVVPLSSTQVAITAEEGNILLSKGAAPGFKLTPWDDPKFIIVRNPNSSTQWLNGLACGVPGNLFSSNLAANAGSADVLAKVVAENSTANAEKTIGILATDYYDTRRDQVRMLAFQSFKQGCSGAYLPDSSATSFDKKNVRDGHYGTFGYTQGMFKLDANNQPASPAAKRLIEFMAGTEPVNGADPIAEAAKASIVPICAMSVRKATDGGALQSYSPAKPCGCYFESVTPSGTKCEACSAAGTCAGAKVCRFGYCEAK